MAEGPRGLSHQNLDVIQNAVAGAAVGNITVTGIKIGDVLKSVVGFLLVEGLPNTITVLDLTSEFTITALNTINNAGGTSSATGILFVTYIRQDPAGGPDLGRT